jgi:predicted metal-binding membrane protein
VIAAARSRSMPQPTIVWVIAGAWALAITLKLAGFAATLHHHEVVEGGQRPFWLSYLLFLIAWQVHITAMMLPSSLPLVRLFGQVSRSQARPTLVMAAFLGGYALVWSAFGAGALFFDTFVHRAVDTWPWLAAHTQFIAGGVLVTAGLFQFTDLKERCLAECRHPAGFLLKHYGHGARAAFNLGHEHGIFCVGCCWALMLLMFAVGVANLLWMAPLTLLMFLEKAHPLGGRIVRHAGFALVLVGVLVVANVAALPGLSSIS